MIMLFHLVFCINNIDTSKVVYLHGAHYFILCTNMGILYAELFLRKMVNFDVSVMQSRCDIGLIQTQIKYVW
jgi:hypothetical protein